MLITAYNDKGEEEQVEVSLEDLELAMYRARASMEKLTPMLVTESKDG